MKRWYSLLALAVVGFAAVAGAAEPAAVADLRDGSVPEDTVVTLENVLVTAVMNSSFTISDQPVAAGCAIWVYVGFAPPVAEGDVLTITGRYAERDGLSTLFFHGCEVTGSVAEVPHLDVTAMQLMGDVEGYESCLVFITDGLIVNEILPDGDWVTISFEDARTLVRLNAYWYDSSIVEMGQCYNNALGIFTFHEGHHVLKVLPGGLALTDCSVPNDPVSFGGVKALYR